MVRRERSAIFSNDELGSIVTAVLAGRRPPAGLVKRFREWLPKAEGQGFGEVHGTLLEHVPDCIEDVAEDVNILAGYLDEDRLEELEEGAKPTDAQHLAHERKGNGQEEDLGGEAAAGDRSAHPGRHPSRRGVGARLRPSYATSRTELEPMSMMATGCRASWASGSAEWARVRLARGLPKRRSP